MASSLAWRARAARAAFASWDSSAEERGRSSGDLRVEVGWKCGGASGARKRQWERCAAYDAL